jgi:hypothetical protein
MSTKRKRLSLLSRILFGGARATERFGTIKGNGRFYWDRPVRYAVCGCRMELFIKDGFVMLPNERVAYACFMCPLAYCADHLPADGKCRGCGSTVTPANAAYEYRTRVPD